MNFEYYHWTDYFSKNEFSENFLKLKEKFKNKNILLYCAGIYFEALNDKFNLNEHFKIVGISDVKFDNDELFKNYKKIQTKNILNTDFDYILILSPNPKPKEEYLTNLGVQKEKIYNLEINSNSTIQKLKLSKDFYLETKNFSLTKKYFSILTNNELNSKLNYEKVLKRIKNKKEKIKILFLCEENQKWCYQNLYKNLEKNDKFEVLPVALFPMITKSKINFTQKENEQFFKERSIETIDIYDYEKNIIKDISYLSPDIVFYQEPWHLFGAINPKIVSEFALTIMTPYGYSSLNADSWGSDFVKENYSNLWKFFSESNYHNEFYEKTAQLISKDIVNLSGYLKFDEYLKKETTSIWKKPENPKIIYAPHHSITKDGLKMSTFKENYKFFLDFAKNHQEFSFVYKPHPSLKNTCIQEKFMTEEEYDAYENEWNNLENSIVYNQGDYFDLFKTSSLLITDCSSFLGEYYPSKNPIILLNRNDRDAFDDFGQRIKNGFYIVNTQEEIEHLINKILIEKNDTLKKARDYILIKEFYIPKKPVWEIIINYLEEILL